MIINAKFRTKINKSANRNMRKNNEIPAIIYGKKEKEIPIQLNHDHILNQESKKEFYKELTLIINKKEKIKVKIQEIQRHPFKLKLIHIDFLRI